MVWIEGERHGWLPSPSVMAKLTAVDAVMLPEFLANSSQKERKF
jgi:hypothetical protein